MYGQYLELLCCTVVFALNLVYKQLLLEYFLWLNYNAVSISRNLRNITSCIRHMSSYLYIQARNWWGQTENCPPENISWLRPWLYVSSHEENFFCVAICKVLLADGRSYEIGMDLSTEGDLFWLHNVAFRGKICFHKDDLCWNLLPENCCQPKYNYIRDAENLEDASEILQLL